MSTNVTSRKLASSKARSDLCITQKAALWRRFWVASLLLALAAAVLTFASRAEARGPVSVAPIAEQLVDAVVNISTSQSVKGPGGKPLPRVPDGSPFEDLFEDFFNKRKARADSRARCHHLAPDLSSTARTA